MVEFAAVIFDMDGVIFDSERLCIDLWKPIAEKNDIPDIEETMYRCIGVTSDVTRKIFLDKYGEDFPVDKYQKQVSRAFHEIADQGKMPVKEGAESLLKYLKENHILTAIASSTRTESVRRELRSAGLLNFFREVVGGDMAERSKPAPDIFLEAAGRLHTRPKDCIVIEDSYNGIRAAKAAGMTAVMVPDLLKPDEEMRKLADHIFNSLTETEQFFRTERVFRQ